MLRYVCLLGYPDGVPVEEGERWYLGTHTQEAKHLRGLRRYVTWWGAVDWMTLRGRDPQRGEYPESWRVVARHARPGGAVRRLRGAGMDRRRRTAVG